MAQRIFTLTVAIALDVPDGTEDSYVDRHIDKALDNAFDGCIDYDQTLRVSQVQWKHNGTSDPAMLEDMGIVTGDYYRN